MSFPLPPTLEHVFVDGQVRPYYGGPVDETVLYTKNNGQTWLTAKEAGLPLLPAVKPPVFTAPAPVFEPAPAPAPAPEPAPEPQPFIEEMEEMINCGYNDIQYRWNFRPHSGAPHYQKVHSYSLYELVPVDHCDYGVKVEFDFDKELILEEKIERTGRNAGSYYYRYTYKFYVIFNDSTYEVVLEATEA